MKHFSLSLVPGPRPAPGHASKQRLTVCGAASHKIIQNLFGIIYISILRRNYQIEENIPQHSHLIQH